MNSRNNSRKSASPKSKSHDFRPSTFRLLDFPFSAIVLAGGHSRRMDTDKALLSWQGEYLIQRIVRLLKKRFKEIWVVTGETKRYTELLDVPVLEDVIKNKGPMGGLYTGLLASSNDYNFVVACDMPLIDLNVLDLLIREIDSSQIIVPEIAGFNVPTMALYHKSCLVKIEEMLQGKDWSLQSLLKVVTTKVIPEAIIKRVDPQLRCFMNLNTSEDWQRLTRWLESNAQWYSTRCLT